MLLARRPGCCARIRTEIQHGARLDLPEHRGGETFVQRRLADDTAAADRIAIDISGQRIACQTARMLVNITFGVVGRRLQERIQAKQILRHRLRQRLP